MNFNSPETWIDPHSRTGKAWVPAIKMGYRERSEYAYKTHKPNKGPRIIVLNAGNVFHGSCFKIRLRCRI